jgi:AcrR family transcriptional regulator
MSEEVRRRPGGRSARVREAVVQAALEAMVERGAGNVTIGDIARRADVQASSIRRRWGSAESVMLDAMLTHIQEQLPVPDTGTARGDLAAFARLVAGFQAMPLGAALTRSMAVSDDNPELSDGRMRFWLGRYHLARGIVDRAVERGELATGTSPQLVLEMLVAPLYFRALLLRQPIDDELIDQVVDTILRGMRA